MYQDNLNYFKELSMYILAGKRRLNEVRTTILPELMEKARGSPACRRTPRRPTIWTRCATALKRKFTIWS